MVEGFTMRDAADLPSTPTAAGHAEGRENKREKIIAVVLDAGVTFWRDGDGCAFATVQRDGRTERYRVRSLAFKNIVRLLYGDAHSVVVKRNGDATMRPGSVPDLSLAEALGAFEAMALRGAEREPRPRLCRTANAPSGSISAGRTGRWCESRQTDGR